MVGGHLDGYWKYTLLLRVILFQFVNGFCPPVKLLQLVSGCSFSSTTADIP
jgi:hypothetical protein